MKSRKHLFLFSLIFVAVPIVAGLAYVWPFIEDSPPVITLDREPVHLGRESALVVKLQDAGLGLRFFKAVLMQGHREITVAEKAYPNKLWSRRGQNSDVIAFKIEPLRLGAQQGPATLMLQARDRSFLGFLHGNSSTKTFPLVIDTVPPTVTPLSGVIHLNRGGSGVAVYQISKDAATHGVRVGEKNFTGYTPWKDRPRRALCFFAYAQDAPKGQTVKVWAADRAGNQASSALNVRLRWRRFRHVPIKLSPRVLNLIRARFVEQAPPDKRSPLDVFLMVNQKMRQANDGFIKGLCKASGAERLWRKAFVRPRGKPMAGFGERRSYLADGIKVSNAVHLGSDLADVERSPIIAAARGQVLFADGLGIYGNAVILDHGQGIVTLYGHLTKTVVKKGDLVERGARIGISGATGLALGDHLHFSVLVGGEFVRPAEWWDPHWVQDNIFHHFKDSGLTLP